MITIVADRCGVARTKARAAVDELFDEMAVQLGIGDEVPLPGIGKLSRARTAARPGRNLRTGQPVQIPAGFRAAFATAPALKRRFAAVHGATQQAAE